MSTQSLERKGRILTANELIKKLQSYQPDTPVFTRTGINAYSVTNILAADDGTLESLFEGADSGNERLSEILDIYEDDGFTKETRVIVLS